MTESTRLHAALANLARFRPEYQRDQVNPPVLPLEHKRKQIGLPELIGLGPFERPHVVRVRPRRHLLQCIARLVQHPGHGRGARRQRRSPQEHVADPLTAPIRVRRLEHQDGALGQFRQLAARRHAFGLVHQPSRPFGVEPPLPEGDNPADRTDPSGFCMCSLEACTRSVEMAKVCLETEIISPAAYARIVAALSTAAAVGTAVAPVAPQVCQSVKTIVQTVTQPFPWPIGWPWGGDGGPEIKDPPWPPSSKCCFYRCVAPNGRIFPEAVTIPVQSACPGVFQTPGGTVCFHTGLSLPGPCPVVPDDPTRN